MFIIVFHMKNPLKEWDEKGISAFHIKTTLVASAGTFVDGYDLTAGSLVFPLIEKSLGQGLEGSSEILFLSIILGNFLGAIIFGYLARHGRKKILRNRRYANVTRCICSSFHFNSPSTSCG